MLALLAAASLLAAAAPAANAPKSEAPPAEAPTIETPVAPTTVAPVTVARPKDPVTCRTQTPIGTKLPKKICVSKSDQERQTRDSQEALQLLQRRSGGPHIPRDTQ